MRNQWYIVALLALVMVGLDVVLYSVAWRGVDGTWGQGGIHEQPGEARDSMPIMPGEGEDGMFRDVEQIWQNGEGSDREA
ncbi:hypothetical protein KS4_28940 [Poriferisphaera corsica]|uniref:Uncharacterized protein n=1 Tax=Poriferisphaera corsica TaxID=2528020 RepID=A0A517YX66_9BACT|nr:hypothetical protein [Poriferisphaera corsica]QDU34818.1 hypothetical protein KS4_28940 [Poriferisphaera corsica]